MDEKTRIIEALNYVRTITDKHAKIGIVLGSGLGDIVHQITESVEILYENIPHFAKPTVIGHKGSIVFGKLSGIDVIILSGRYHYYEGYSLKKVTMPIRLMHLLGVEKLILTNASGAVNESFKPGQLMLIKDHLNLTFLNPLMGENMTEFGPRFPDSSEIYSTDLIECASQSAKNLDIEVQQGVYAFWSGPSYETPAEIRMIRTLGADAVGMSTVPEALVASHMGMKVLGISCLTNMACGILKQKLSHQEVLDVSFSVKDSFIALITNIVSKL